MNHEKISWIPNTIFYHIYPLGFCGAPQTNDFRSIPTNRLKKIITWIDHLKSIGITAIYLGPLFESSSHGYDTVDYYSVDRRLGTNSDLKEIVNICHNSGIRVILDAVLNHVGRDFWAFKDILTYSSNSRYCGWISGINFNKQSPYHDGFSYDGWNNYYNLVKLNLKNPEIRDHLLYAIKMWIDEFNIDGLRLDAADCLDLGFISELATFCKKIRPDFWLMGEIIHGDYSHWIKAGLDSVTNYECYKGLFSSLNDVNYFEIAYALNRQFGEHGIYRDFFPYTFADNHDVDRVASILKNRIHLYPLYILLFTMPGIPSIYYGSESGAEGKRTKTSDNELRPMFELVNVQEFGPETNLINLIKKLSIIRHSIDGLKIGNYQQLYVNHQQLVFWRKINQEFVIVALNSSNQRVNLEINLPEKINSHIKDRLNEQEQFEIINGKLKFLLWPNWGRILTLN